MAFRHLGANSRGADMTKSQKDKYLRFNESIDLVCDATQQKMNLFVGISSGNTLILGAEDFTENFVFHCRAEPGSPSLDGDWVLRVPETQRNFTVMNDTGFICYVESAGSPGSQVQVNDGGRAHLHTDGETVEELKREVYDLGFYVGTYTYDAIFGAFVAVTPFSLPANLTGSEGYAFTATQAGENNRVISIQKNEVEQGTVTFAPATNAATFSFASKVSFAVGDRLRLVNGSDESPEQVNTLADVAIALKASA
jgi:hypothetical protein